MTLPVYTPPPRLSRRERFAEWRGARPFWGGLFTLVAGFYMWGLTAAPVGVVVIQGVAGISAIVIALVFVVCVVATWSQPSLRTVTGGIVIVLSLAAIVLTNLGGFLVGTLLGLHGGATMIAWKPFVRRWSRPDQGASASLPAPQPEQPEQPGQPGPAGASGQVAALVSSMSAPDEAVRDDADDAARATAGARPAHDAHDSHQTDDDLDDYADIEGDDDADDDSDDDDADDDGTEAPRAGAAPDPYRRPTPPSTLPSTPPSTGMSAGMTILPSTPPAGPAPSPSGGEGPAAFASSSSVIR